MKHLKSDYDSYFPEESQLYYSILTDYSKMIDVEYSESYKMAQKALILAERYNTIGNDSGKLKSILDANGKGVKTDIKAFFYGRYRILREVHTHCRMIWARGKEEAE